MSLRIQKNIFIIIIFIFIGLITISSTHQLSVSLIGSFVSLFLALFIYTTIKLNITKITFLSYHFISICLLFIFQTPEIAVIAFLSFLLRETILLTKEQAEKGSRKSLLWDLGAIKPKRQISSAYNQSLPFIIASFVCSLLNNFFSIPTIALAYFPIFLFSIGFGSLIVEELSFVATE
ncbi:hypothetical protein [Silvanigrella aquatica]|uniref:Uncharacterized protein n=1 Tax=Silvanigrella aquatica TaxID=1915309 RepID=A0A1L4D2K7_9BACT|nr:hypothetical protein [Silvanigrella aquatica]APJ04421.1 hypothetical protein AXG55_11085 [Silvanigrella aquatica]